MNNEELRAFNEGLVKLLRSSTHPSPQVREQLGHVAGLIEGALEKAAAPGPYAYACPAKCGCIWRDNHDGTMSLFGKHSQSCEVCEPLCLDKLIPLYEAAPADKRRAPASLSDMAAIAQLEGMISQLEAVAGYLPEQEYRDRLAALNVMRASLRQSPAAAQPNRTDVSAAPEPKEWVTEMAAKEDGAFVGAGSPDVSLNENAAPAEDKK